MSTHQCNTAQRAPVKMFLSKTPTLNLLLSIQSRVESLLLMRKMKDCKEIMYCII